MGLKFKILLIIIFVAMLLTSYVHANPALNANLQDNLSLISDIDSLNNKISSLIGMVNLPDETIELNEEVKIEIPQDITKGNFEGAFLEKNGKYVNSSISINTDNLIIKQIDELISGSTYYLKIFTSNKSYIKKIYISDFIKFDNNIDNVIKIHANPEKGFNYEYYLYIPANIHNLTNRRLLVEGDNSDPNDSQSFFDRNANEMASYGAPHIYGQKMQVPVLVPAFPRDFHFTGQDDYTYLQYINRGALTTQDMKKKRVDLQLIAMIKDAQKELGSSGIKVEDKIFITGFSASGKFAERFTTLHPDLVEAMAVGGIAGSTTLPFKEFNSKKLRFPVGVNDLISLTGTEFDLNSYKGVAQYLYTGELDTNDGTEWRDCYEEQDAQTLWSLLGRKQVPDRWNKAREVLKDFPEIKFETFKGIGHDINNDTINGVVSFLNANWNANQSQTHNIILKQNDLLKKASTELQQTKIEFQDLFKKLSQSGSSFQNYEKIDDSININNDKTISVNFPINFNLEGFQGAILELSGETVDTLYSIKNSALIIEPINGFYLGETYTLNTFTYKGKYTKKIKIKDFVKFDNSKDIVIQIPPKPKSGFNYGYYLFIPKNIQKLKHERLLVEADDTPPSDLQNTFIKNAYDMAYGQFPHIYGRIMQIPVLVPAFPRDFQPANKDDYTYLQIINRGALATKDTMMERVDLQMIAMIKDAQKELSSSGIMVADKVLMTGFSSSSKFAERFTILHPEMVGAMAIGGVSGMTTLPLKEYNGEKLRFPVGVNDVKELTGKDFDLDTYKQIPQYLYMGEKDKNDPTEGTDFYQVQDVQTIWRLLGRKQLPDRWNKTQEILKDFPEIKFATYKGIGHDINNDVIKDIVKFFLNTGLIDNSSKINSSLTNEEIDAPEFKTDDIKLPQISEGIIARKGTGVYKNSLIVKIDKKKLPINMQKFVFFEFPCYPVYTSNAAKEIIKEQGAMYAIKYIDKIEYYATGTDSCFVFLFDANKRAIGFAIIKKGVVVKP